MALITLIRAGVVIPRWAVSSPTCPPLGMAYLAAALRHAGHRVSIIDPVAEGLFKYVLFRPGFVRHGLTDEEIVDRVPVGTDAIGISVMCSQDFPPTRPLVEKLRSRFPNAFFFTGGEHPTALPRETLLASPGLDVAVIGEGEETAVELMGVLNSRRVLNDIKGIAFRDISGGVSVSPRRSRRIQIDDIPEPAWDLFNLDPYLDNGMGVGVKRGRSMPMLASRGCPFECTFCSNALMWGPKWICRDPVRVVGEMLRYVDRYGAENFDFYDLTAIINRDWVIDFTQKILESGCRFTWQVPIGTRSEVLDKEVIDLLYRSGCRNLCYAPESGSSSLLKKVKKRISLSAAANSMKMAVRRGVNVRVNIMFGLPGETHWDRLKTFAFLAKLAWFGAHDVYITTFSPYPGSELFAELTRQGRLSKVDDDYLFSIDSQVLFSSSSLIGEAVSWVLSAYRLTGLALFFALSFLFRPWRLIRIARNLLAGRQESRLEKSLVDVFRRFMKTESCPKSKAVSCARED